MQIDDGQFQITNSSSGDSNSGTTLYMTSLLSGQYIEYNNSQSGTVDVTGQVTGQVDWLLIVVLLALLMVRPLKCQVHGCVLVRNSRT